MTFIMERRRMNKIIYMHLLSMLLVFIFGCATTEQKIVEAGGKKLSADEITKIFSDVREDYVAVDIPGVTAVAEWKSDGTMKADWKSKNDAGSVKGVWYVKSDERCIKYSEKSPGGPEVECASIYQTGNNYTSINPDGSVHGTHTLSPL